MKKIKKDDAATMDMILANIAALAEQVDQLAGGEAQGEGVEEEAPGKKIEVGGEMNAEPMKKAEDEKSKEDEKEDEAEAKKGIVGSPDKGATASDDAEKITEAPEVEPAGIGEIKKAVASLSGSVSRLAKEVVAIKSLNADVLKALNITESTLRPEVTAAPVRKGMTANPQDIAAIVAAVQAMQGQPVQKSDETKVWGQRGRELRDLTTSAARTMIGQ